MLHLFSLFLGLLRARIKSRARLEAEILILGHQLGILRRQAPKRVALGGLDRLIFALIYRLFPSAAAAVPIIRPETIVRWHRAASVPIGDGDHGHRGDDRKRLRSYAGSFGK
jgi:hypothetical protein